MITITYDVMNGKPVADGKAFILALMLAKLGSTDIEEATSSSLLVDELRLLIKTGKIDYRAIVFKYTDIDDNEHIIRSDADGRLNKWPKGFCDRRDEILEELISWNV